MRAPHARFADRRLLPDRRQRSRSIWAPDRQRAGVVEGSRARADDDRCERRLLASALPPGRYTITAIARGYRAGAGRYRRRRRRHAHRHRARAVGFAETANDRRSPRQRRFCARAQRHSGNGRHRARKWTRSVTTTCSRACSRCLRSSSQRPDAGAPTAPAVVSLRGPDPSEALVTLDGQTLNDGNTGDLDLSQFAVPAFNSVNVTEGLGPTDSEGSNTFGGAVNLVSLRPTLQTLHTMPAGRWDRTARRSRGSTPPGRSASSATHWRATTISKPVKSTSTPRLPANNVASEKLRCDRVAAKSAAELPGAHAPRLDGQRASGPGELRLQLFAARRRGRARFYARKLPRREQRAQRHRRQPVPAVRSHRSERASVSERVHERAESDARPARRHRQRHLRAEHSRLRLPIRARCSAPGRCSPISTPTTTTSMSPADRAPSSPYDVSHHRQALQRRPLVGAHLRRRQSSRSAATRVRSR